MSIDWYWWVVIAFVIFGLGVWSGIAMLYNIWLKPGLARGILDFGNDTYKMSRIVKRNTRV